MEATFEEKLTLTNYKAHLQSVLSNLEVASKDLASTLTAVEDAKKLRDSLAAEILAAQLSLQTLQADHASTVAATAQQIADAERREAELKVVETKHAEQVAGAITALSDAQKTVDGLNLLIKFKEQDIEERDHRIAELEDKEAKRRVLIAELDSHIDDLNRDVVEAKTTMESEKDKHEKAIHLKKAELSKIEKQIEAERALIGEAERRMSAREIAVAGRERSIAIVQRRIDALYKQYFPQVTPPKL